MVHFVDLFKGLRTWDDGEPDSKGSDAAAASAKAHGYLMSAENQALVEKRLGSLLFPPGLVSSGVRKLFKYTGSFCCLCPVAVLADMAVASVLGYVKAHDWLIFCTVFAMWAFRGTLPTKYLMVLFCFFDIVTRVTADRVYEADCEQLELDIAEFLCLLELTFPATELTIVFHLLQHVVLFMQLWGPVPRYWMFAVERMLGFLVRKVKNRAHPEANITASYQLFRAALLHRRDIERSLASLRTSLGTRSTWTRRTSSAHPAPPPLRSLAMCALSAARRASCSRRMSTRASWRCCVCSCPSTTACCGTGRLTSALSSKAARGEAGPLVSSRPLRLLQLLRLRSQAPGSLPTV